MSGFTLKRTAFLFFSVLFCLNSVSGQTPTRLRIPYREGKLWGYCDTTANLIFRPQYDSVGFYDIGDSRFALFKKGGKLGLLDPEYKEYMPAATEVLKFSDGMNDRGQIVYIGASDMNFGEPATVYMASGSAGAVGVYEVNQQLKIQKELLPALYDDVDFYYAGVHIILVKKAGKWGAFNEKGEKLCELNYDEIYQSQRFPGTWQMKKRGLVGLIGQDYFFLVPQEEPIKLAAGTRPGYPKSPFDTHYPPEAKELIVKQEAAGKASFGFQEILFDKSEDLLYPPGVLVRKNKKMAIWNAQKNEMETDYYADFFAVQQGGVEELMEIDATAAPKQDLSISYFVRKGNKCGVVDEKGDPKVPFVYDGFGTIASNYYITQSNGKYGVTLTGTIYPPIKPVYDSLKILAQLQITRDWMFCILKVQKDGMPGFVGENGKEYFKD